MKSTSIIAFVLFVFSGLSAIAQDIANGRFTPLNGSGVEGEYRIYKDGDRTIIDVSNFGGTATTMAFFGVGDGISYPVDHYIKGPMTILQKEVDDRSGIIRMSVPDRIDLSKHRQLFFIEMSSGSPYAVADF